MGRIRPVQRDLGFRVIPKAHVNDNEPQARPDVA